MAKIEHRYIKFLDAQTARLVLVSIRALLPLLILCGISQNAQAQKEIKILALAENAGHHKAYSDRAKQWLNEFCTSQNIQIDYISNTSTINATLLKQYQLFLQLDYPPFAWTDNAKSAFEQYLNQSKGAAWIGFHHASLLGEFEGYQLWQWFAEFMGDIRFKNYIAGFAAATVNVEQAKHPIFKGVDEQFLIQKEEWYTYDKSPRARVKVLASVDESSYQPASTLKMGDHPVIWTNPSKAAKNVYIFMGHGAELWDNLSYQLIVKNAILWALNLKN